MDLDKIIKKPDFIKKKWGGEVIITNNEEYCGKILKFNKGSQFSMHFHVKKKETWMVVKGSLKLVLIDTTNAEKIYIKIYEGDVVEIDRFQPHQLYAIEDSEIFEVSTTHYDEDSYRVEKGDSQK
ncbi:MAG: cupin domain-containing protein [bacterium]